MKKEIKTYKKAETILNLMSNLCNTLIMFMVIYMIGITGALECGNLSLQTSVIKIIATFFICAALFIIKKFAIYFRIEVSRKKVYYANSWY